MIEVHSTTSAHRPESLIEEKHRKGIKRLTLVVKNGSMEEALLLEAIADAVSKPKTKTGKSLMALLRQSIPKSLLKFAIERDSGLKA